MLLGWAFRHFPLIENNFSWNIWTLKRKFLCKKLQEMQVQLRHTQNKSFRKHWLPLKVIPCFPPSHSHITQAKWKLQEYICGLICFALETNRKKKNEQRKTPFLPSYASVACVLFTKMQKLLKWQRSPTLMQHDWACPKGSLITSMGILTLFFSYDFIYSRIIWHYNLGLFSAMVILPVTSSR